MNTMPIPQSVNPVTLNRENNCLTYKLASAICDPLQSIDHAVLQFVIARVAICIVAFFATNGILTIAANTYVLTKDLQVTDAVQKQTLQYTDMFKRHSNTESDKVFAHIEENFNNDPFFQD
ncbi:MAG: hypothetical protein SP4CHLAM5_02830 [Chlamydiia bacterium]|nr:hypothetical protein [Chlamydiia bacterium]MCH9618157.1 hypothetical protein [Chlamydiia bacterium]MCH9624467.1 hypothetical protein [Chlamydiia bacterium]